MNPTFFPCRTTKRSKLGRYFALYFYPFVGVALLFVPFPISIELNSGNDYTVVQIAILLLTTIVSIVLSAFMFCMSRKCYRMETRYISIDNDGFVVRDKTDRRYSWNSVGGIAVIAYAANASRQYYQSQICIFLEPYSEVALRRLRNSYLYGAFNCDKYVLLDYNLLSKVEMCTELAIVDLRSEQLSL